MTKEEIRKILQSLLSVETRSVEPPEDRHWEVLRNRFNTEFPEEFVFFIELMSEFVFPGDILNVRRDGQTNGNDSIEFTYDHEAGRGPWDPDMIPFCGVGNGDYFLLSAREGSRSNVYYYRHESQSFERYFDSFEEWIKDLPEELA